MDTEVLEEPGKQVVLLGNEAIARGALEAGVGVVAAYPGTPSSEVPMVLSRVAKKLGFYFEYSTNEKVALETAAGAAWSGVRSLVSMKHFGLNVAADSLMPIAYAGTKAGLVIFVADDPQAYSSIQSEQDTRYYARLARLPMLEPSNPQECRRMTKLAFELSEEFEIPVILRTTTRVSHSIGTVELRELGKIETAGEFEKDPDRFYNFRPHLQELHRRLDRKIEEIEKRSSSEFQFAFKPNRVVPGEGDIGIITSGVSFEYVREGLRELEINAPIAKLGLTHPFSKDFVANFTKDKKAVLVVEELEPILETFAKRAAKEANPNLVVHGKDLLPRVGEYNMEVVVSALGEVFGKGPKINFEEHRKKVNKATKELPPRKPVLCPGCPHRSTFYAVKKIFGENTIYAGDIGCYMMGSFEPYKMQDFIISMGAGLGLAHGISRVSDQDVVVFIGDSTFFHAGMPELLNYGFNPSTTLRVSDDEKSPLVVVMDNGITAMTGHQPNPSSVVKIKDVARAFGAEVRVASAFDQKGLINALRELKEVKGARVLVSRGECRLLTRRKFRKKGVPLPKFEIVDQKEFEKCKLREEFACPAFEKKEKGYRINSDLCWGCGVCAQICPKGIKPAKAEGNSEL